MLYELGQEMAGATGIIQYLHLVGIRELRQRIDDKVDYWKWCKELPLRLVNVFGKKTLKQVAKEMVGFAGAQVDVLYEGCNFYQNLKVHFKFFPIFHIYKVELLDVVELHFFKQLLDACEQSIGYKRTTGIFKNLLDIFLILVYNLHIKELPLSLLVQFQQSIAIFLGRVTGNSFIIKL